MKPSLICACCFVVLTGCQGVPVLDGSFVPGPTPRARHAIVLFEETEATNDAVKQVVLRHVPPGTPMAQAQEMLEQQRFTCRPYSLAKMGFFPQFLIPEGYTLPLDAGQRVLKERKRVPVYSIAEIQPGNTVVAVRVDPTDHTRVGIDFSVEPPSVRLAKKEGQLTAQELLERGFPQEASSSQIVVVSERPAGHISDVDFAYVEGMVRTLDRFRQDDKSLGIKKLDFYKTPVIGPRLLGTSPDEARVLLGTPRRLSSNPAKPLASYRFFQRRIWRSLMPIISAACHHLIFPAVARKSTSCSFIARSTAVLG